MPCACKKPLPNYPENVEWGPIVWKILHGLAEVSGKQTLDTLQSDERRLWVSLLKGVRDMLPCNKCREHYAFWISSNPIDDLASIPYTEFGTRIRTWLHILHNNVNTRLGKSEFLHELLPKTYTRINITESWKRLEPVMRLAIQLNGISLNPWRKWLMSVRSLQGIYGV